MHDPTIASGLAEKSTRRSLNDLQELQDVIKRDPNGYKEEFKQQISNFQAQVSIFDVSQSSQCNKDFGKLITFLSHVSVLYPDLNNQFHLKLCTFYKEQVNVLQPELRMRIFESLILMKSKKQFKPTEMLDISFFTFGLNDKRIRARAFQFAVNDLKKSNLVSNQVKLNNYTVELVRKCLPLESNVTLLGIKLLAELYRRRVFRGKKAVNVLAEGILCKNSKLVRTCVAFFLGIEEKIESLEEEEDFSLETSRITAASGERQKNVESALRKKALARTHSRRTKARIRAEEKNVRLLKKIQREKRNKITEPRFAAIELINNPEAVVEELFKRVKAQTDLFEARLNFLSLGSRLIFLHKIVFLPFFSYLRRFLQPYQKLVTIILALLAQACHELIPAEVLYPEVKTIANNFVNDRSNSETMAVGLNAIREIVLRVPLITQIEGFEDLIQDLVAYKDYRKSKSVVIAARSLLNVIREVNPLILRTKDRGKDTDKDKKLTQYAVHRLEHEIPGASLLNEANVAENQFLTTADFVEIKRQVSSQQKEQQKEKRKRKIEAKRTKLEFKNNLLKKMRIEQDCPDDEEYFSSDDEFTDSSSDDESVNDTVAVNETLGVLNPYQLEGHVRRKRRNLAERLEAVYQGRNSVREEQMSKAQKQGGTSNTQKTKNKNYAMLRHSSRIRKKQTKSLRQQQYLLKKHIKCLEKNKKTLQKISRKRRR